MMQNYWGFMSFLGYIWKRKVFRLLKTIHDKFFIFSKKTVDSQESPLSLHKQKQSTP